MADLPEILSAVTLGPDDQLIIRLPYEVHDGEIVALRDLLAAKGWDTDKVLIHAGDAEFIVLRATKAEGSTVGQCGDLLPPVFSHARYTYCHLAAGHTGSHSDGTATWTNKVDR